MEKGGDVMSDRMVIVKMVGDVKHYLSLCNSKGGVTERSWTAVVEEALLFDTMSDVEWFIDVFCLGKCIVHRGY